MFQNEKGSVGKVIDQKFDPLQAWKNAYEQTETFWGKALNETIKTEEYSAWMGRSRFEFVLSKSIK